MIIYKSALLPERYLAAGADLHTPDEIQDTIFGSMNHLSHSHGFENRDIFDIKLYQDKVIQPKFIHDQSIEKSLKDYFNGVYEDLNYDNDDNISNEPI